MSLKTRHLVTICIIIFSPLFWWVGDLIDATGRHDFFLFKSKPQELRWYIHFSILHATPIIYLIMLYDVAKKMYSKKSLLIIKITALYHLFILVQYWLFRYDIPFLAAPFIVCVLIIWIKLNGR